MEHTARVRLSADDKVYTISCPSITDTDDVVVCMKNGSVRKSWLWHKLIHAHTREIRRCASRRRAWPKRYSGTTSRPSSLLCCRCSHCTNPSRYRGVIHIMCIQHIRICEWDSRTICAVQLHPTQANTTIILRPNRPLRLANKLFDKNGFIKCQHHILLGTENTRTLCILI